MTMNFTDPSELRLTGENPYMVVFTDPDAPPTTNVSLWRVQLSPAGPGHTLFFRSELTDGEPRIYTDNIMLTRWLQEEITAKDSPFADSSLPAVEAEFEHRGDVRSFITEEVVSRDDDISLTWYDFLEPFAGITGYDLAAGRTHGHYAIYVPAQRIRVTLNGEEATGGPIPREREGRPTTSCFLAWAETWVRPKPE